MQSYFTDAKHKEDVLPCLAEASKSWHNIATNFQGFGAADAARYLFHPSLIQQEIKETLEGFHNSDPVQVMDGLLDIAWEVAPVYEYFKKYYQFLVHLGNEPEGATNPAEELVLILRVLSRCRPEYGRDLTTAVHMAFRLKLVVEELATYLFDMDSLYHSAIAVTESVFSKFPRWLSEEEALQEADLILQTEGGVITATQVSGVVGVNTNTADVFTIFRNEDGKIRKPPSHFIQPSIAVTSSSAAFVESFAENFKVFP